MKLCVVVRDGQYLRLRGVFEYAEWCRTLELATPMGAAKASQWASAYGARTVPIDAGPEAIAKEALADRTPETKREGFAASGESPAPVFGFGGF